MYKFLDSSDIDAERVIVKHLLRDKDKKHSVITLGQLLRKIIDETRTPSIGVFNFAVYYSRPLDRSYQIEMLFPGKD